MPVKRIARLKKSAAECMALAQQTYDPRARAVLAVAAVVWEKLAEQQACRDTSSQIDGFIDLLDPEIISDRGAC
jgi:hypothetical protein